MSHHLFRNALRKTNMKSMLLRAFASCGLVLASTQSGRAQVNITFDYTYDTHGFFSGANNIARTDLEAAASSLQSRLADSLSAITPGGGNSWSSTFMNPETGGQQTVANSSIAANTLVVYVGARSLSSSELALAGFGGFSAPGIQPWLDTVSKRGQTGAPNTDFGPWGGSISFSSTVSWYFDPDPSTVDVPAGQNDFYSVALHELGHVLGIGGATSWDKLITGSQFTGAGAMALYGGPVPVTADHGHWADGMMSTIPGTSTLQEPAMDPTITVGTRKYFTDLDFAGLSGIGWEVTPVPEPEQFALVAGLGLLGFAVCRRRLAQRA